MKTVGRELARNWGGRWGEGGWEDSRTSHKQQQQKPLLLTPSVLL
jgi:hypothetical protein